MNTVSVNISTTLMCTIESYGIAGVGDDSTRVGLLEAEERAGGFLVAAPGVCGVSDSKSDFGGTPCH